MLDLSHVDSVMESGFEGGPSATIGAIASPWRRFWRVSPLSPQLTRWSFPRGVFTQVTPWTTNEGSRSFTVGSI